MKIKFIIAVALAGSVALTGCVSSKKYNELQSQYQNLNSELLLSAKVF